MKKITSYTVGIALLTTLLLASCAKTDEPAPISATGSAAFAGSWFNSENSSAHGPATYPVRIEATNTTTMLFSDLYGFKAKVSATVNNTSFTIPSQIIEGNRVSGSGELANANQINMRYLVNNGLSVDTVSATLTK